MTGQPSESGGVISSRANPRIARLRALRRRADREQSGLFLAEGIQLSIAAIEAGIEVEEVIVAPSRLRSDAGWATVEAARRAGRSVVQVTPDIFESFSSRENPSGLAVVGRQRWSSLGERWATEGLCSVALEGVQDPGNLGTILRTMDAVGAAGLVLIGETTDPYDPSALRASTGALFWRPLARASLAELDAWKRANGVTVVGTSDAGAVDYRSRVYRRPMLVLLGSEQHGLSAAGLALCDSVVSVPMAGRCDSLNLSVAAAVVLYQAFDQVGRGPA